MSDNAILAALWRSGIGKEERTTQSSRAMARTILDEALGFRPDFIEHQLAHAVRDPRRRAIVPSYTSTAVCPCEEAANLHQTSGLLVLASTTPSSFGNLPSRTDV